MPGYDIDPNDPKAIARLLVALALANQGEIRISAPAYDDIVKGHALLIEYDRSTSEIVVRVTSGKIMVVPPENQAWLRPKEVVPQQRAETQATQDVVRRTLRSDEELAELEEQLDAKTRLAREVNEGKGTKFRTVPPSTQA
jgi:hypothetical protein